MKWLLALALAGCGPKLGPPEVTYGPPQPLPMRSTSVDASRWYVVVDTVTQGERVFFFDTGFSRTTCDDDFVADLGLRTSGLVFVHGAGGRTAATKARLPELQVGGHGIRDFACIVRDLDQTSSIKDPYEVEVAGVIGADLLSRFVTEMDPASARITLYAPGAHPPLRGPSVPVRRSGLAGVRFMVPASLADKTGWWLLDTGAKSSHVDGARYGLTPTSTKEGAWIGGSGKNGGRHTDLSFYDGVAVGLLDTPITGLRLVDHPHGPLGFDILGLNVLGHYRMTLDAAGKRLFLDPLPAPVALPRIAP